MSYFYLVPLFFISLLIIEAIRITYFGLQAKYVGKRTVPYEQHPTHTTKKILCIGDSMGVGVGSSKPENSLFGNLGKNYPQIEIENLCRLGVKTKSVYQTLVSKNLESYDTIFLIVGGMDIINFTPISKLQSTLRDFLPFLKSRAKNVVIILPKSTECLPIYRAPVSWILKWRAKKVETVFRVEGEKNDCRIVEENAEIFSEDRKKYFSRDKSHPNDAGYSLWYEKVAQNSWFPELFV